VHIFRGFFVIIIIRLFSLLRPVTLILSLFSILVSAKYLCHHRYYHASSSPSCLRGLIIRARAQDMIHHAKAVARAVKTPFLLADLPMGSYEISPEQGPYFLTHSFLSTRVGEKHKLGLVLIMMSKLQL